MSQLPSGTVTFVFSDIEGSTSLLKQLGDAGYADALAIHRRLVRETFAAHDGEEIDTQGDAFFYSFRRAREAVAAAVAVQRAHADEPWPAGARLRIRLGLHTGEPAVGDDGYTGLDVVRASRIAATARGGQVLLSEVTSALVANNLPEGVKLKTAGRRQLKDIDEPEAVFELVIPGVDVTSAAAAKKPPKAGSPGLPPDAFEDMPPWLQGFAERLIPSTNRLIEERVLAKLDETKRDSGPPQLREPFAVPPPKTKRTSRSLADEISHLQALREAGALTEKQYQQAVEKAIRDDH